MSDNPQDILLRLVLDAQDLVAKSQQSREEIDKIKQKIMETASQSKVSFEIIANEMKRAFKASADAATQNISVLQGETIEQAQARATKEANIALARYSQNVNIAKRELTAAYGPATGFAGAITKINQAMQIALGIGFYSLIRQLITGFGQLIQNGEEFAKALFKLGASVRSLQKQGLDITIAGTLEQIRQLRTEFGVFATKDLVAGVAQLQLLTRQFGFTNAETLALLKSIAALSVVLGKDFQNTAASVALFLSSGYGEALQRAGIAVNRLAVVQEANRMGIKKGYTALTEYERAHAAYNLIIEQSKDLVKELTDYQSTYIGQIEKQRAEIEDLKNALSLGLIPADLAWTKIKLQGINLVIKALNFLLDAWGKTIAMTIAGIATLTMGVENLKSVVSGKGWVFDPTDLLATWDRTFELMQEEVDKAKIKPIDLESLMKFTGIDAAAAEAAKKQNEAADEMLKTMQDLVEKLLQIQEDFKAQSDKLWQDYVDDRNKIIADASQELIDKYADLQKDLAKIAQDYNNSVAKAQLDAQRKLEDLAKETRDRTADANKKYRENEQKAERDHQEALRRLREEFLFNLEDALRQRDALQVLRLIRRYQLDKEQENRSNKDKLDDLRQQHQDELADIKKSEADKRAEIQRSLQEQLADLRANYEQKVADRNAQYADEVQGIKDQLAKDLAARKDAYDKELADLQESFWGADGKLAEMLRQWAQTNGVTEEQAKAITDVLAKYFGQMSITDAIFNYYKSSVAGIVSDVLEQERILQLAAADALALQQQITDAVNAAAASRAALGATTYNSGGQGVAGAGSANQTPTWQPPMMWYGGGTSTTKKYPPAYASGASFITTRPKTFLAGEVPERIDVTPLNQLNSNKINAGLSGNATVEILLGQGLEGKIIDNALGQVAVVLRKELEKR